MLQTADEQVMTLKKHNKLKFGTMNMLFLLNPPGKATIHVENVNSLMQHMRLNSTLAMRSVLGGNHNPADDTPGATCVFWKSSEGMKLTGSYWPCS
ncbi:unnamed protein product [Brassica rapa]|uniref:Uncharacterized protein n=2 Tax=Brassica TaxID=3705 RepID=A0A3P5ZM34_BRACM|nr:unnamed protein product [Brassica napus]CAG7890213.1 unnamed protein product [Brassica rapa]CDY20077.1 BnaA01g29250D [Brassica napus]VDC77455.1 unnamed protein product [Brassica rapa]